MAKKAKPIHQKTKPDVREERLIVSGDPQRAIEALLIKDQAGVREERPLIKTKPKVREERLLITGDLQNVLDAVLAKRPKTS